MNNQDIRTYDAEARNLIVWAFIEDFLESDNREYLHQALKILNYEDEGSELLSNVRNAITTLEGKNHKWRKTARENTQKFEAAALENDKLKSASEKCDFFALAICNEAGELAGLHKKLWRGDNISQDEFLEKAKHEVADIYTYLLHYSDSLGFDLDQVAAEKAEIVSQRLADKEASHA
tara:strand:+ start:571 stop:1104 length:534 start_codon:yes stop_codon:yes gene_type:complete